MEGVLIVKGADDGTICVWSSNDGKLVDKRKLHSVRIFETLIVNLNN